MLRISKLADYATVIMAFCAKGHDNSFTAAHIAEKTHINLPTVSKVLKLLTRHQLLFSQRGMQGGYRIAKPAQQLNVAEIIAAVDGQIALTTCNLDQGECELSQNCATKNNWHKINNAVYQALAGISLQDMIDAHFVPVVNMHPLKVPYVKRST